MLILPKWLNKFLTLEEEQQLKDPSKRIFTYGLLASAMLAMPAPLAGTVWVEIISIVAQRAKEYKAYHQMNLSVQFRQEDGIWRPVGSDEIVIATENPVGLNKARYVWTREAQK